MVVVGGIALRHVHLIQFLILNGNPVAGPREFGAEGHRRDGIAPDTAVLLEIKILRSDDVFQGDARHPNGISLTRARRVEPELHLRHPVLAEIQRGTSAGIGAGTVEDGRSGKEVHLVGDGGCGRDADQRGTGQIVRQAGNDPGFRHGIFQYNVRASVLAGSIAEKGQGAVERPIDGVRSHGAGSTMGVDTLPGIGEGRLGRQVIRDVTKAMVVEILHGGGVENLPRPGVVCADAKVDSCEGREIDDGRITFGLPSADGQENGVVRRGRRFDGRQLRAGSEQKQGRGEIPDQARNDGIRGLGH